MLRHDGAVAATDEDQALIERYSAEYAPDRDVFKPVGINLLSRWKPNSARWESFGWDVPGDEMHQFYKRLRQEERGREALLKSALAKLTPEEVAALDWQKGCRS
jgi:hypothetical protein